MKIDFIQIIYEESQREHCYPFATVYKNETCSPYFENDVIARIVPDSGSDYISVCSWGLSRKRGDMLRLRDKNITNERILQSIGETSFDVAILTPRGHKDIRQKLIHWHPIEETERALNEFEKFIHFPEFVKNSIYENHFIARAYLYKQYVSECLKPAIQFMDERPEVFMADSGYITRKKGKELEHALKLLATWGKRDYPIGVFILERLFSIWINDKDLTVINL